MCPLVVLLFVGCAGGEATECAPGVDGGAACAADAGWPSVDAAVRDPFDAGSSPVPHADAGAGIVDPNDREDDALGGRSCYDGADNDGDTRVDCEDERRCGGSDYCCVGATTAACCTQNESLFTLAFESCPEGDADGCDHVGALFGAPVAQIEGGAFVPNGEGDSGAVIGRVVDPTREHLSLTVEVRAPSGCADCVDVITLGLGDAPAADAVRVVPDVAVMVRRAHRDVALLVAGEVVGAQALTLDADVRYTLALSPDGDARLSASDGSVSLAAIFIPRGERRVLLYGRTPNRDAEATHARALSVSGSSRGCEIPSALARRAPLLEGRAPSVVVDDDRLVMAFARDDGVHLAVSARAEGPWNEVDSTGLEGLDDPDLHLEGDRFVIYATRDGDELVRVAGGASRSTDFEAAEPLDVPGGLGAPSVLFDEGRVLMAAEHEGGIVLLESDDGRRFTAGGGELAAPQVLVAPGPDFTHFDDDAVAEPALVVDGAGLVRLYYAGRRGTRWAIGVRVSGDAIRWRDPLGDGVAALASSGQTEDALGVRGPAMWIEGGTLHLAHAVLDGLSSRLSIAEGATR